MGDMLQITPAEWDVMEVLWSSAEDSTAAQVIDRLQATHNWNHRTIRTLLARLVEKRAVRTTPDGGKYRYQPLVSRERCVRQEVRTLADRLFRGDVGALLVQFVEETQLSQEQIEALQRLLDQAKPPAK